MKISIIIPTYNEQATISACLKSLAKQSYPDLELIVVDDGSTDKTMKALSELRITNYELRILKQNHKGAGVARNYGASKASGEILVFVDADMTFDKNFIKNLIAPILKGASRGTWSREEYVVNWDKTLARCWNINEGWEVRRRHSKKYPKTQKVFRAILKSEFDKAGGFESAKGYADDWSLSEKLGYKASEAPGAVFYHQNPDNLREIFIQAKWIGKRPYKLGKLGAFYALARASFPESLWQGLIKSLRHKEPAFFVFKMVYDLGVFVGILENLLTGKVVK